MIYTTNTFEVLQNFEETAFLANCKRAVDLKTVHAELLNSYQDKVEKALLPLATALEHSELAAAMKATVDKVIDPEKGILDYKTLKQTIIEPYFQADQALYQPYDENIWDDALDLALKQQEITSTAAFVAANRINYSNLFLSDVYDAFKLSPELLYIIDHENALIDKDVASFIQDDSIDGAAQELRAAYLTKLLAAKFIHADSASQLGKFIAIKRAFKQVSSGYHREFSRVLVEYQLPTFGEQVFSAYVVCRNQAQTNRGDLMSTRIGLPDLYYPTDAETQLGYIKQTYGATDKSAIGLPFANMVSISYKSHVLYQQA